MRTMNDFEPSEPTTDVEVFNPSAFTAEADVMSSGGVLISEPIALLLGMLDEPRTEMWLGFHANATRDRLDRLAKQGVIVRHKQWVLSPVYWHRTKKGDDWYLVWEREMERRRKSSAKGPFLDREFDQIPDNATLTTFEAGATGMRGTLIQVPHDPVARDIPYEPPADMVEVLGLLAVNGGDPSSTNYLVGACVTPTNEGRVETILSMLHGMGFVVPQGHGWVRTMMGWRMHQTWTLPKEEPTP